LPTAAAVRIASTAEFDFRNALLQAEKQVLYKEAKMNGSHLRPVDDDRCPEGSSGTTDTSTIGDLTPKMMGMTALMTMGTFLVYGLIRVAGQDAHQSLLITTYFNAAVAGLMYVLSLIKRHSFAWLLAMIASVSTFTGACFAVSRSANSGHFLLLGAAALFVGFLTSLFRNIDDRVSFTPLLVSMLVSTSLILFCLS